ncbi:unnamed protein product [Fusarium graminearum]|uniref:Chromosome 1, complete genome n=2 Tax=Gibberella zeae TaxID=5518 RepID=I1RBZ1_GIBZE|nr:hypothetical protein FGSG_01088 [Fusarium graminearum PH-1]EYB33776.1 hypothetical protein FG05_01088 [Fusarium graminearum]ESU06364.1 hypothetical protein FGSG_01088 [Fusarium graminearum PH-1]CAG1972060.1 unnamed protein product [Fusarium graminearum]CAG1979083.1 unnamed protein product [Fusarium graminearum]CEF73158.1 unnamed protein product [Fusarium graminearum]|eukprot:XP_011316849.1 hypothetical protein FGSG_01088 [Fusarium graminearum PH-1]
MANGFGSLERFFTKKKTPAALNDHHVQTAQPASAPPTIPQFPSPSFIRPKTSRMAAREEVRKQPASRVPSFPGSGSPHQMDFTSFQSPTSRSDSLQSQYSPLKASFMPTQADSLSDNFDVCQFPRPPTSQGGTCTSSPTRDRKPSMEARSERSLLHRSPRKRAAGGSRLETPPSSDLEDEATSSPQYFHDKELPALPQRKPPTPDSSPELRPLHIAQLTASKSIDMLNKAVCRDIRRHFAETLEQRRVRKAASLTSQDPYTNRPSISSSTLREPDFNEFFELSDDDIAELAPEETANVDTSMPSAEHSAPGSNRSSLLVLTPLVHASKPAVAGAFEAARIAARYEFDFVYVVNLWTDYSQPQSDVSTGLGSPGKKFRPLAGRLLASYGMENVNAPVQISTASHRKILKTPGWIEYRPQSFRHDEFARGYAHAFHTGQGSGDGSVASRNSSSSSASVQPSNPNRGIVFAAYRAPRADESLACTKDDLSNLHKDAEALVEMLVDINVTNQLREPQSQSQQSEETGPMPTRRFGFCATVSFARSCMYVGSGSRNTMMELKDKHAFTPSMRDSDSLSLICH